jgi:hypothetical protein
VVTRITTIPDRELIANMHALIVHILFNKDIVLHTYSSIHASINLASSNPSDTGYSGQSKRIHTRRFSKRLKVTEYNRYL